MTNEQIFNVEAHRVADSHRVKICATIALIVAADHPPNADTIRPLCHRDVAAYVAALIVPNGLPRIIPWTSERLFPFRLANLFRAIPTDQTANTVVNIATLRAKGTTAARKCLACLGALDWSIATESERRLVLAALFLRAQRAAS